MKKLFIIILLMLVMTFPGVSFAGDNVIKVYTIPSLNGAAIAGSASVTGETIDLSGQKPNGFFSIQLTTVGAGSAVTVEYLVSHDNTTFTTPIGATEIVTGFVPGTDMYSFSPMMAPYLRLKVTEENGADVTSCTVLLAIQ